MPPFKKIFELPVWVHAIAAVGSFAAMRLAQTWLDASYAASKHPVDYATGQTTFDGPTLKGYYAQMQDLGTLDVYVQTQLIDFSFIASVILTGIFLATFVGRAGRAGSWGRKAGIFAAAAIVAGALCDVMENLVSFVLLADPQGFSDWLALPYSGFASAKFVLLTLGMGLMLVALIFGGTGRLLRRPGLG